MQISEYSDRQKGEKKGKKANKIEGKRSQTV